MAFCASKLCTQKIKNYRELVNDISLFYYRDIEDFCCLLPHMRQFLNKFARHAQKSKKLQNCKSAQIKKSKPFLILDFFWTFCCDAATFTEILCGCGNFCEFSCTREFSRKCQKPDLRPSTFDLLQIFSVAYPSSQTRWQNPHQLHAGMPCEPCCSLSYSVGAKGCLNEGWRALPRRRVLWQAQHHSGGSTGRGSARCQCCGRSTRSWCFSQC